jgi:pimeloyl-ACP methyl ester carboxylesterase
MNRVVLVHGNPETAAVWGPLISQLARPRVTTLCPPGFGAPVPDGFPATTDAYLDWLVGELELLAEPVDLVGHDWGGGHVIRVAMERPDLIRSWAMDIAGCFAPNYVWHDRAQVWQTPGAGEEAIAAMIGMPAAQRAEVFQSLGIEGSVAHELAEATDETMGRCILTLYRSARQPTMARLGERLTTAARRPGLVIIATEDGFTGGEHRARWAAEQAGAAVAVLPGRGHWWMLEDPQGGAQALERFWTRLD